MSEHKSIFKSASIIGIFTIISRITGFLRDVLIANIFGTGLYAQAFFVAFKIPNLFRSAVGEGAGNAAFVPVFCECLAQKERVDFLKLANTVLWFVTVITAFISIAGIIFSSPIVRLIAPGFIQDIPKYELTVRLTRWLFPYLVLVTVSACLMSIANAQKSFAVPASSSVVFNVVLIMGLLLMVAVPPERAVYYVCFFTLIAGLFQIAAQLPPLLREGLVLKGGFYANFLEVEAVRKIVRLAGPRIIGSSIYQMNVFVDTIFASLTFFVADGAIAAIYYANRIIQLPFAIIALAFSNAALPALSVSSASRDMERFKKTLLFSMRAAFLGVLPAMIGIMVFSKDLVEVIFQRGHFGAYSTFITSQAVFFYALGLIAYAGVRFLSCAFYALQDTMTPVKTSFFAFLANVALNAFFIFVLKLGIAGLALASVVSAIFNFILLYRILSERTGFCFSREFSLLMVKAVAACAAMALFAFFLWNSSFLRFTPLIKMSLVVCLAMVFYAGCLMLLRVKEAWRAVWWFRRSK